MSLKISIITVCYNAEKTILNTIVSVNQQNYPNIEHIIVDGASNDRTFEIIKKSKLRKGEIISESDKGSYNAMNKALNFVTGDIVTFLNADDVFANEDTISNVCKIFNLDFSIVYGNVEYFDNNKNKLTGRKFVPGPYIKNSFLKAWHPAFTAFFVRFDCFKKYGQFREDLKVSADFELMYRFQELNNLSSAYIDKTITYMGSGGTSAKFRNIIIGNMNIIKAFKIHDKKIFFPLYLTRRLLPKALKLLKIIFFK